MNDGSTQGLSAVTRREVGSQATVAANAAFWDSYAPEYQAEHGDFLGDNDFVWGPEGLREADLRLLGALRGRRVLEIGCGAAQCARWLAEQDARVVAMDISQAQLAHAQALDAKAGVATPLALADVQALPFGNETFDVVCSAFGAIPFIADSATAMKEAARVLRPGGLWVFSTSHPTRWMFPDDGGPGGLTVAHSYFDRQAYVEQDVDGAVLYAEHHRTMGDRVREIVGAGLEILDIVEPEWPRVDEQDLGDASPQWGGGWTRLRGEKLPGTVIFVTRRPD